MSGTLQGGLRADGAVGLRKEKQAGRLDAVSLVANATSPALAIDPTGSIREWNDRTTALLGHPRAKALGRRIDALLRPRDIYGNRYPLKEIPFLAATLEGEASRPFVITLLAATNQVVRVQVAIVVVLGPNSVEHRVVLLLRPLRNRRRADEVIERVLSSPRFRREAGLRLASDAADTLLSDREVEVLELLAGGRSTTQVSESLAVSVHTVRNHTRSILQKLESHSRVEAVAKAYKLGIL